MAMILVTALERLIMILLYISFPCLVAIVYFIIKTELESESPFPF